MKTKIKLGVQSNSQILRNIFNYILKTFLFDTHIIKIWYLPLWSSSRLLEKIKQIGLVCTIVNKK